MTPTTSEGRSFAPYTPPAPTPPIRPAPTRRRRVPEWIGPFGVGAVVLAVALATMSPWPVGVYYDDGIYLILGKALATGEGYRYLNLPGHPAATHYPPGYPALLALLWTVAPSFPENVALFKLVNAMLLSLAAAGLFLFARRELKLGYAGASAAILLGCLTVPVLAVASVLFSEPLFLALLAVALPACERAMRDQRPRTVIVAASLAGVTTLVRSLGISLVGALVLGLLLRRRRRAAAQAALVAGAVLLPWQLWTTMHSGELPRAVAASYGPYTATFRETLRTNGVGYVARVAAHNVRDIARPIGAVFAPGPWKITRSAAVLATIAVLGAGATLLMRRAPATALFLLGYGAIVVSWPYAPDRFLWGVWPLLLLTLALGAAAAVRGARARRAGSLSRGANAMLVAAAALLAVGLVRYNARGYRERWWDAAQRSVARRALPLVEWTERYTRPDDVIASDSDPLVHLYTGRHVVPSARWAAEVYPGAPDRDSRLRDLRELLATYPVRYLLLSGSQSVSGAAAAALEEASEPSLRMLTILPTGGAAFATVTGANRE
jgi:hypothetical protein